MWKNITRYSQGDTAVFMLTLGKLKVFKIALVWSHIDSPDEWSYRLSPIDEDMIRIGVTEYEDIKKAKDIVMTRVWKILKDAAKTVEK